MKKMLISDYERILGGKLFLSLVLALYPGLGGLCINAQNSETLSKKPPVIKVYVPEKDITIVQASLMSTQAMLNMAITIDSPDSNYRPSLILSNAWYTYQGRNPTLPQSISFSFIPKYKKKGVVNFSLNVENTVAYQGEVVQGKSSVEVNGRNIEEQYLQVTIPTDVFLRASHGKKVEFKVGSKSYKLSENEKKGIAALAGIIESLGK